MSLEAGPSHDAEAGEPGSGHPVIRMLDMAAAGTQQVTG